MKIRESRERELDLVLSIHEDAFGLPEGPAIARLVRNLLAENTTRPVLSLLAEENSKPVGSVLFTPVSVAGCERLSGYILAPLAVASACQGKGTGTALIEHGLTRLQDQRVDFVLVLGDPGYYSRSGFTADHKLQPPYDIDHPEAWMARELRPGILQDAAGVIRCVPSLHDPAYW